MLVAARDGDGVANLFNCNEGSFPEFSQGKWFDADEAELLFCNEMAGPFCTGIPPGEKRIIETVSVTYKPEPKSAVEELVEAAFTFRNSYVGGVLKGGAIPSISVEMLFSALARVEAEKKGGN